MSVLPPLERRLVGLSKNGGNIPRRARGGNFWVPQQLDCHAESWFRAYKPYSWFVANCRHLSAVSRRIPGIPSINHARGSLAKFQKVKLIDILFTFLNFR